MKVMQVIPSLVAGGAEQACIDINAALVAAGDESFVVSVGGPLVARIEQDGGVHYTLPIAGKWPWRIFANALILARLVRRHQIDILHARSRAPAWAAWLAARMTGCGFVTTFHAAYKFRHPAKKFYNSVMARGQRVIAISQFIARHVHVEYGVPEAKIALIPRGIDLTRFMRGRVSAAQIAAVRGQCTVPADARVMILPARLSRIKGQSVLIDAMARLAQHDDWHAVIVGSDQGRTAYRAELEQRIAAHGLQTRVHLLDHCADMPAAYAIASLVVAPSLVPEGFGRVPVEAQAMGVPVIASDLGAYAETIEDGLTGWLVPPDDAVALANAIERAMTMSGEARATMAERAARHAHATFGLAQMVARTFAVYRAVLAERG